MQMLPPNCVDPLDRNIASPHILLRGSTFLSMRCTQGLISASQILSDKVGLFLSMELGSAQFRARLSISGFFINPRMCQVVDSKDPATGLSFKFKLLT